MRSLTLLFLIALLAGGAADAAAQAGWLGPNWSHRVKVTVDAAQLDAEAVLTDFPLVIDGTVLASAMGRARSDGADLRVTKADGTTELPVEIVGFDAGARKAQVWFRADVLSASAREFYVYYGNPSASAPANGSVWNDDYVAVYHFEEDPAAGVLADWTSAGNDATSALPIAEWGSDDRVDALLGRGWQYDGTTHYVHTDRISTQDESFTISAWLLHTTRSTDFMFQSNPGYWQLASQASNSSYHAQFRNGNVDARYQPDAIALNEFHHFAFVFDQAANKVRFYYDGVPQSNAWFWPPAPETNPESFYTGVAINPDGPDSGDELCGILGPMYHNPLDLFHGIGDEFRVNDAVLPTEWIATEVANQGAPSSFFSVSAEETATSVPVRSFGSVKGQYRGN